MYYTVAGILLAAILTINAESLERPLITMTIGTVRTTLALNG